MPTYEVLLDGASKLPVADRVQLIEALWETVPDDSRPPLSSEWLAEIAKRSAEFDAGLVQTIPWDQVRGDAMQRLTNKKS